VIAVPNRSRRGLINIILNRLVSTGAIGGFRTNYETRKEPNLLRITVTGADGANAAAVQIEVLKALGQVGEGAEIIVESPEIEITGDEIRAARKLLGWHRAQVAQRARGITGNTIGKAEGDYPGEPPTLEQLAEIRDVLEAAGVEFTSGEPGVKLKATKARKAGK
jgi:hypothetical protein